MQNINLKGIHWLPTPNANMICTQSGNPGGVRIGRGCVEERGSRRLSKRRSARLGGVGGRGWPKGVGCWLGKGGAAMSAMSTAKRNPVKSWHWQANARRAGGGAVEAFDIPKVSDYRWEHCDRDVVAQSPESRPLARLSGRGRAGGLLHQSGLCALCGMWRLWSAAEPTKLIACYTTAQRQQRPLTLFPPPPALTRRAG